ncbi:Ig-like domain-containing domain [Chitinophagaceae bacterium 26-R-25]|nr:Ig-like domain-containing domain [Chitinophagaceae bacterium 26-R-25]
MRTTKHIQLPIIVSFLLVIAFIWQFTSCAVIVAPTGGPRDSLPPVLMSAVPKDSLKGFTEKKIVFEFNEYVEVKDIQKNLIVSPYPKTIPNVEYKLRTVTVRLKDTLQPNTTYTLDFGDAIHDINEGNIIKHFTYIFTTGNHFDKGTFSGRVIVAETGNVDSTLTVFLYKNREDSAVSKQRPSYIARVDSTGHFHFRNLPADTFALYAWKDEGAARYFGNKQIFAFADNYIVTSQETPPAPVTLYAFFEPEDTSKKYTPTSLPKTQTQKEKDKAKEDKRFKFSTSLTSGKQDILDSLRISFESQIKTYDTSKFRFTRGDFTPIKDYTLNLDTSKKDFTLHHKWIADTPYHIILMKNFAEDSTGKYITKDDTVSFRTMKKEEYGSLRLRFTNLDFSKKPLLVLLQNDKIRFSTPLETNQFRARLFLPGEYVIRIVYDENKNGKWDTGSFFGTKRQPEKATTIKKKLTVKANWDNDVDVIL